MVAKQRVIIIAILFITTLIYYTYMHTLILYLLHTNGHTGYKDNLHIIAYVFCRLLQLDSFNCQHTLHMLTWDMQYW